jgi:hypothetical protein
MSIRLACGLAAAAWALSAAAATAGGSVNFDLFRRLCIDTHADPAAALAVAKAEGFVRPMAAMAKDFASLQLNETETRARLVDEGVLMLVVGHKPFPGGPKMTMIGCGLVISPADGPTEEALAAWAGTGEIDGADGQPFFLFTGDPTHRQPAAGIDPDAMVAAAHRGDLQIAGASHKPDSTVLVYGLIQP